MLLIVTLVKGAQGDRNARNFLDRNMREAMRIVHNRAEGRCRILMKMAAVYNDVSERAKDLKTGANLEVRLKGLIRTAVQKAAK